MSRLHVERLTVGTTPRGNAIEVSLAIDGASSPLWWRSEQSPLSQRSDALVPALLPLAMRLDSPLDLPGTVSARLFGATGTAQDILHNWDPTLQVVPIDAATVAPAPPAGSGVGCFFSGGVDSFYTVLRHRREITHLVTVYGFDIDVDNRVLRERVSARLRKAAAELGKELIEVETNIRRISDTHASWGKLYNGAALATVALLLAPAIRKMFIPASYTYATLFPWGSHPLLDPLWSTEGVDLIHDGCGARRTEKVAALATSSTALGTLRVCWENPDSAYNCGRCEKCLRTMVNLQVAGALDRCTTFDRPLDVRAFAALNRGKLKSASARAFIEENLEAVERTGNNPELAAVLRDTLRPARPASLAARALGRLRLLARV